MNNLLNQIKNRFHFKNMHLRKKALIIFFISSFCFVLLTALASRLYISAIRTNYDKEQESNKEYIGFEFSRIVLFYAENDPDLLVNSDLLQLYSLYEDNTHMCILLNDYVIYGEDFFRHVFSDQSYISNPQLEIKTYQLRNRPNSTLKVIQLLPEFEPQKPITRDFRAFDTVATILLVVYLIILTSIFMVFLNRILKPMEEVKKAANEIKNGNLDYQITYDNNDEIGEVFKAIEEMRNELKVAENVRQQYENNRNELLSNITHDLKTPITSIKGYIEGIMDGVADTPEKIDKYAHTIYKHTSDMDALINDLFLMSKLDIDELSFDFERLNITDFLNDCYEDYCFDLQSKGIQFIYDYEDHDPLYIKGDRQNLMRALVNIISNSSHYMDKSPEMIKMSLEANDHDVIIKIKDNGKGIAQDQLENIFSRFYRVDGSRNSNAGGSGIGLSIVKKIINKHEGSIHAQSQEGQWCQMVIRLPRID